jgi:DNA replication protein DnaC
MHTLPLPHRSSLSANLIRLPDNPRARPLSSGYRADNSWEKRIKRFLRPDLLICDDFGLTALTTAQAEDFYEIVTERHLKSSMIITSNQPPQDWIPLFPDPVMANSALDRLVHHAHHIIIEGGESYRKKLKPPYSN